MPVDVRSVRLQNRTTRFKTGQFLYIATYGLTGFKTGDRGFEKGQVANRVVTYISKANKKVSCKNIHKM